MELPRHPIKHIGTALKKIQKRNKHNLFQNNIFVEQTSCGNLNVMWHLQLVLQSNFTVNTEIPSEAMTRFQVMS
jgi:hypothetical protein